MMSRKQHVDRDDDQQEGDHDHHHTPAVAEQRREGALVDRLLLVLDRFGEVGASLVAGHWRPEPLLQGPEGGRLNDRAGDLDDCDAGEQVGHVVLAEVDQREPERARVGESQPPLRAGRPRPAPERRRAKWRSASEGMAAKGLRAERVVQRRPRGPEGPFADLEHHPLDAGSRSPLAEAHQGGAVGTAQ